MPEQLSEHFTLTELTKSATASRYGINNTPGQLVVANLRVVLQVVLEPVRAHFVAKYPNKKIILVPSSGYRCPELNRIEGGSITSQHMYGEAVDFEIPGVANDEIWMYIRDYCKFDQLIAEFLKKNDPAAGWIHVSYKTGVNRAEAKSCIARGKYVPGLQYA